MLAIRNLQVPPPSEGKDFESLCCDLWREIWQHEPTQKNAGQGNSQEGVDIVGAFCNKPEKWVGIQCKVINYNKKLGRTKIDEIVGEAKTFQPKLSELVIATTGKKDGKIERIAREITDKHTAEGLFIVIILGWQDILERLESHPKIFEKYYGKILPASSQNYKIQTFWRSWLKPIKIMGRNVRVSWLMWFGLLCVPGLLDLLFIPLLGFLLHRPELFHQTSPYSLYLLLLGFIPLIIGISLQKARFVSFFFCNFESNTKGEVFITRIAGQCFCGGDLRLYLGSDNAFTMYFQCQRNPDHSSNFDFTTLTEIS